MKFLDSSSQAPEHQMTLQICKVHNMLYLESISEYIGAHLNKQTKKKKKKTGIVCKKNLQKIYMEKIIKKGYSMRAHLYVFYN